MGVYKWDVYQVYRVLKDYDNLGEIMPQNLLVQVIKYEGSHITLRDELEKRHWLNARDLLNEENFKRVF